MPIRQDFARQMTEDFIPTLYRCLEERLIRVLFQDASRYARVAQTSITADIYLAALYHSYENEVGRYFRDSEPLASLSADLSRIDQGVIDIEPMRSAAGGTKMLTVQIDDRLVRSLHQAATLAPQSEKADLDGFMRVLTSDREVMDYLREKRNLVPASL
jgi:hypothetical protein